MFVLLPQSSDSTVAGLRQRIIAVDAPPIIAVYAPPIVAGLAAWAWAVLVFRAHSVLLGTASLGYGFGLRHAVHADHIAVIDNVTRKLIQEGKCPVGVGFFFALSQSLVLVFVAAATAATTISLAGRSDERDGEGSLIDTRVSTLFLFANAAVMLVILIGVWRSFRHVRCGPKRDDVTWHRCQKQDDTNTIQDDIFVQKFSS